MRQDPEGTDPTPAISVVVNTFNRRDELMVCINSLLCQKTDAHFEIIVVDDASTDGTAALLETLPVITCRPASNEGLALGRNRGADAASGPLLAFLDDDEFVGPAWIDTVLDAWRNADPDIAIICTTPRPIPGTTFNRRYLSWQNPLLPIPLLASGDASLPGRMRRYLQRINNRLPSSAHIGFAPGGSITIRADAFWQIGGYQKQNFAAGEDDYFCEAIRSEFGQGCIDHSPAMELFHNFKPGFRDSINRNFRYGKGAGQLTRHVGAAPVIQPLPALLIPLGVLSTLILGWWAVVVVAAVPYLITLPHLIRSARRIGPLIVIFPLVMAMLEFFDWAGFATGLMRRPQGMA